MGAPALWKIPTETDQEGFQYIYVSNPERVFAASMIKHAHERALKERPTENWYPTEEQALLKDGKCMVDFEELLWLLDPNVGDLWFSIAEISWEDTKRELLKSDAFNRLVERIKVNDCAGKMYRSILSEFEICYERATNQY